MTRDYIAIARQYEDDVLAGKVLACKWVRLAMERNRRDLSRVGAADFPYRFDAAAATARCFASEQFPHIKGPKAKVIGQDDEGRSVWQSIELEPWQCWLQTTAFGWLHAGTGLRRFKVVLILVPRKNAKSTLGATNILCALTIDGEGGAEVYSAATTRDQAKVSAEIVWEQARRTHSFRDAFGVRIGAKTTRTLEVPETASKFSPLSADAHSLDGLNVSFALIDELHAHKTRAVWDVLETAIGARSQPMLYAITTAGSDANGICYEKLEYLHKVLDGLVVDEEFFGINYTIDDGDEWDDEASWRKANPNYGVSVNPEDLLRKVRAAKQSPDARAGFLTKHLNVWVTSDNPCLSVDSWRKGQSKVWRPSLEVPELLHEPCYVGIDLASKIDLRALSFVFPPTVGRPKWRWIQCIWTPEESMRERAHRDRAPYPIWAEQGWLLTEPGVRLTHRPIVEALIAAREFYDIQSIGLDPWHADRIEDDIIAAGFEETKIVEVAQTYAGMSSACLRVQADILAEEVDAGGCPVTGWCVSNVVPNRDGKDNLMFAKGKSRGRIDPVIAATIATAVYLKQPAEEANVYLSQGVRTLGE